MVHSGLAVVRRLFFFQAEDGIRDIGVTGVQTCALPIFLPAALELYLPTVSYTYAEQAQERHGNEIRRAAYGRGGLPHEPSAALRQDVDRQARRPGKLCQLVVLLRIAVGGVVLERCRSLGLVELGFPLQGSRYGSPAVVFTLPLIAVETGPPEERVNPFRIRPGPEREHRAQRQIRLAVAVVAVVLVAACVSGPQPPEPLPVVGRSGLHDDLLVRESGIRRRAESGAPVGARLLPEHAAPEKQKSLLSLLDRARRAFQVPPAHSEVPAPIVDFDLPLAVAPVRQGGPREDVDAGPGGRHLGVAVQFFDDLARPRL